MLAWLFVVPAAQALAVDSQSGTGGASFLKLFGSARAMAMGRSLVSLAEGTDALTWNPAGLALSQTREGVYSYLSYIEGVSAPLYMGYVHPVGRNILGANLAYMSVDGFDKRDDLGRPQDSSDVQVRDGFVSFLAARSFWYEKVFLGAGLKAVQENNAGARRSSTVGDFGAIFKPNQLLSFGFASQNMGGSRAQVYKITRLGVSLKALELLQLALETSKPSDNGWRLGLGAELIMPEELLTVGQVSVRAGYYTTGNQGTLSKNDRSFLYPLVGAEGLSFGLGLYSSQAFGYWIGFDYAMVPLGGLGSADYLSLKLRF